MLVVTAIDNDVVEGVVLGGVATLKFPIPNGSKEKSPPTFEDVLRAPVIKCEVI